MIRIASRSPPRSETTPTASTTGISSAASARSSRYSRRASSTGSSLSAYSFGPSSPSYSTKRTTWRWIPRTTSTSRGCCHSSSGSSQGRSRKSGWPVRAISCSRAGSSAAVEHVVERQEHRVRPEQRRGRRPPLRRPSRRTASGWRRWSCDCSGRPPSGCGVRRDPLQPLLAVLRLGEPEQRGQQQPLAAAVVGVVEVAVDAAAGADERRHVDRRRSRGRGGRAGCRPGAPPRARDRGRRRAPPRCRRASPRGRPRAPPTSRSTAPRARAPGAPRSPQRRRASGRRRRAGAACSRSAQSQRPQPSCWRCGQSLGSRSPSSV